MQQINEEFIKSAAFLLVKLLKSNNLNEITQIEQGINKNKQPNKQRKKPKLRKTKMKENNKNTKILCTKRN